LCPQGEHQNNPSIPIRTEGSFWNQELNNFVTCIGSNNYIELVWAKAIPTLDLNQPGKDLEVIPTLYQFL
jgi:hypothetical protein